MSSKAMLAAVVILIGFVMWFGPNNVAEHSASHEALAGDAISGVLYGAGQTVTITAGTDVEHVAHGLGAAPSQVVCTPAEDMGLHTWWVEAKTATTYDLVLNAVDVVDLTWDCLAVR